MEWVEQRCQDRPSLDVVWVEEMHNQQAIAPWLEDRNRIGGVKVWGCKINRTSQPVRIRALATGIRRGDIIFAAGCPGLSTLIEQLERYPGGDFDDMPCALALLTTESSRRGMMPQRDKPPELPNDPTKIWPIQYGVKPPHRNTGWPR